MKEHNNKTLYLNHAAYQSLEAVSLLLPGSLRWEPAWCTQPSGLASAVQGEEHWQIQSTLDYLSVKDLVCGLSGTEF